MDTLITIEYTVVPAVMALSLLIGFIAGFLIGLDRKEQ